MIFAKMLLVLKFENEGVFSVSRNGTQQIYELSNLVTGNEFWISNLLKKKDYFLIIYEVGN